MYNIPSDEEDDKGMGEGTKILAPLANLRDQLQEDSVQQASVRKEGNIDQDSIEGNSVEKSNYISQGTNSIIRKSKKRTPRVKQVLNGFASGRQ